MKIWTKLGFAVLALAMVSAMALTFVVPARAEHVATCEEWETICAEQAEDCIFGESLCYSACILQEAYEHSGMVCASCTDVNNFCAFASIFTEEITYDECLGLVADETGLVCNSACTGGPNCEVACSDEGPCLAACAAASSCDPEAVCIGPAECFGFCAAGGFNTGEASACTCGDDRVNQNCSAPEIVYCNGDKADFYAYNYVTLEGDFDFSLSLADLQQSVEEKTLIKQDGTVKVYLMPDGRVLLVARQPDGKDYFMYWNPNTCLALQEGAEWNVQ